MADVLAFREANPGAELAVLTADPGLIAKAKSFDIPVVTLAGRNWEQPPEKTIAEREVEKLRRENEELRRIGPAIACSVFRGDQEIEAVRLEMVHNPPLTADQIDALLTEVRARNPRVTDFSAPSDPPPSRSGPSIGFDLSRLEGPYEWRLPTQEEIDAYAQRYDSWFKDLTIFIRETPAKLDQTWVSLDLQLVLQNSGNEPAQATRLTIETVGGFLLTDLNDEDHDKAQPDFRAPATPGRFRSPPPFPRATKVFKASSRADRPGALTAVSKQMEEYRRLSGPGSVAASLSEIDRMQQLIREHGMPSGLFRSAFDHLSNPYNPFGVDRPVLHEDLLRPFIPESRDAHAFYWRKTPLRIQVERWQLECDEFQHRMDPEIFRVRVTGHVADSQPRAGAIRVTLFARNLRQPFGKTFPIRLERVDVDTRQLMTGLLP